VELPLKKTENSPPQNQLKIYYAVLTDISELSKTVSRINTDGLEKSMFALDAAFMCSIKVLEVAALKTLNDQQRNVLRAGSIGKQFLYNMSPIKSVSKSIELMSTCNKDSSTLVVGSVSKPVETAELLQIIGSGRVLPHTKLTDFSNRKWISDVYSISPPETEEELWRAMIRRIAARDC